MQARRKRIKVYETTPYGVRAVDGGFAVYREWWDKAVSPVFATREEAETQLFVIAKANGKLRTVWL